MFKISFLYLLFSLLLLPYARAQDEEPYPYVPIPTDTAYKWNVMMGHMGFELNPDNQTLYPGQWTPYKKTRTYSFLGEITIDGKQYHRMRDMPGHSLTEVYIRQDSVNRTVYWKEFQNHPEQILYNFNLNVGDTILRSNPGIGEFYVVDSIRYLNIDEVMRKAIYLHTYYYHVGHLIKKNAWEVWIEGIGSIYGIIHGASWGGVQWGGPIDLEQSELQCLSLKGTPIFKNPRFENCSPLVNSMQLADENLQAELLKLMPNPVSDILTLNTTQDLLIRVYNQAGQMVIETRIIKENPTLNLEMFSSGIYYLQAQTLNTNDYFTSKFIKQ